MSEFCLGCARNREDCCRPDYVKFTTLRDAVRVAKLLKLPVRDIVVYGPLSKEDKKTALFRRKLHNYYYDLVSEDGKILQLKRRKDGSCFFLSKTGHCRIYKARPLICRVYPFWYSGDKVIRVIIDHNGMSCDIVKCVVPANSRVQQGHYRQISNEISYTLPELKRLLLRLKNEIRDYDNRISRFVMLHCVRFVE